MTQFGLFLWFNWGFQGLWVFVSLVVLKQGYGNVEAHINHVLLKNFSVFGINCPTRRTSDL